MACNLDCSLHEQVLQASALLGLIRCGRYACQAKADALLEKGIGSMTDGQAVAQALLHETADAQRAASWALEYEEIAQVVLLICP